MVTPCVNGFVVMVQDILMFYVGASEQAIARGRSRIFFQRGCKNLCAHTHAHHEREARSTLQSGSRARLRALEALRVFDALSCYLSLIFNHSDRKWDLKKNIYIYIIYIDFFFFFFSFLFGGVCPPLNLPLNVTPTRELLLLYLLVVAQWIRPWTVNREVPDSNLLAVAVPPLGKATLRSSLPSPSERT